MELEIGIEHGIRCANLSGKFGDLCPPNQTERYKFGVHKQDILNPNGTLKREPTTNPK